MKKNKATPSKIPGPWCFKDAVPRPESVTTDWEWVGRPMIQGVVVKEVKNVPTGYGYLHEVWRDDWKLDEFPVRQVFQGVFEPGRISAWHAHAVTTDRLCVNRGRMRIVLYDARPDSPTFGLVNDLVLGELRPGIVIVPPKVWHGVQNVGSTHASLLNLVDEAYTYKEPDHWSIPSDSKSIPYTWRHEET
jgi:dTDP-4-dehydrorhamnose 3,5-epimerase